jgi:hypothetical protein
MTSVDEMAEFVTLWGLVHEVNLSAQPDVIR